MGVTVKRSVMVALPVGVVCALASTVPAPAVNEPVDQVEQREYVDVAALTDDLIAAVQETLDAIEPVLV